MGLYQPWGHKMLISTHSFPPGSDMDLARRVLAECALFLTHPRCGANAKQWFLQEFERVRSEAKALLRNQRQAQGHEQRPEQPPLEELFGRRNTQTTVLAPTDGAKSSKAKVPPLTPADRSRLDALFGRQPAPTTPPASSSRAKTSQGQDWR